MISKYYIFLFLILQSFSGFACMGGLEGAYKKYNEKNDYFGEVLCDYNSKCNFEKLMDEIYGSQNWEYDENYYIDYPKIFENLAVIKVDTGKKNDVQNKSNVELQLIVVGRISLNRYDHEYQIVKAAGYKFSRNSLLYLKTRLNFTAVPNPIVTIYAVYIDHDSKTVKVAEPPHISAGWSGCKFYYFVK